ncbi:MAG: hypothetical protein IGQ88_00610 [Gloeomargaritaceae cyanobacterium C42_A2020_066]|nr:hypothetical protein [Gloeomargaritaceae cyanobacterium C42_A2020_066]
MMKRARLTENNNPLSGGEGHLPDVTVPLGNRGAAPLEEPAGRLSPWVASLQPQPSHLAMFHLPPRLLVALAQVQKQLQQRLGQTLPPSQDMLMTVALGLLLEQAQQSPATLQVQILELQRQQQVAVAPPTELPIEVLD